MYKEKNATTLIIIIAIAIISEKGKKKKDALTQVIKHSDWDSLFNRL